jgi:hypothetical protein
MKCKRFGNERSRDNSSRPEFAEFTPLVSWTHVDADSLLKNEVKMVLKDSVEG